MHSKTMTPTTASASKSAQIDLMLLTPAKISSNTTRAETPKSREPKSIKRVRRRTQNQLNATPAKATNGRKAHSASPPMIGCYASSKWSDSPSARSIPLPPTAWIEQTSGSSLASTSDSESGSSSANDSNGSTSPFPEPRPNRQSSNAKVFLTPKTCRQDEQAKNIELSSSGRRMCPLKLISEVMALSIAN